MEELTFKPLLRSVLMILIALTGLFLMISPVRPGVIGGVAPDLLACVVFFWVLRRPSHVNIGIIFGLGLTADLLLGRPTGLGALALLLMSEFLRGQSATLRDLHFVFEWVVVIALLLAATVAQHLVLWLTFAPTPGLVEQLAVTLTTALAYPVVAVFGRYALGLRYSKRRFMASPHDEDLG
ncbi:MAG: rod shape-determining protein MreD [Pseudomonadota bacterium]